MSRGQSGTRTRSYLKTLTNTAFGASLAASR